MNQLHKKIIIALSGLVVLLGLDQWTKYLAVRYLKGSEPIPIIKGVLELEYLENRGAAFGILENKKVLFIIMATVISVLMGYLYMKIPSKKRYLPLNAICVVIMAGAIGNSLIDRPIHGFVIDFIYFKLINFPIFNVADCYVTISSVLTIILFTFIYKDEELDELAKTILPKSKSKA